MHEAILVGLRAMRANEGEEREDRGRQALARGGDGRREKYGQFFNVYVAKMGPRPPPPPPPLLLARSLGRRPVVCWRGRSFAIPQLHHLILCIWSHSVGGVWLRQLSVAEPEVAMCSGMSRFFPFLAPHSLIRPLLSLTCS